MLTELAPWGAVTALGLAAIAGAVTLIQFFVKRHDDDREARTQRKCPHWVPIELDDGRPGFQSLFTSPPGTLNWICSRCGLVSHDYWIVDYMVKQSVKEHARKSGIRSPIKLEYLDDGSDRPR